jgi:uncharacterized membrane protein
MIKRTSIFLILAITLLRGPVYAWRIDDYQVTIDLNKDSSFVVTERILANFSGQQKHGIIRNIPVEYRDEKGNNLNVDFRVLGVFDENGSAWQYQEYYSGIYKVLKIGSPSRTYSGQKMFVIKYTVAGALLFLEDHDELFWNATGTEWDAPIENVMVNVHLPQTVNKESLLLASYSGKYGSRTTDAEAQVLDEENIVFKGGPYQPYEGLTIVLGWPKGIVNAPVRKSYAAAAGAYAPYEGAQYSRSPDVGFGLFAWIIPITFLLLTFPVITFFIMFSMWRKYGKDPQLRKSVVVEYKAPEGLSPAEIGTLVDDRVDIRDISSVIIDLAIRGYLKIAEGSKIFFQKSYSLVKLKDYAADESLRPFERIILEGIFGYMAPVGTSIELSALENNFYTKLDSIKDKIFEQLKDKGFYAGNPDKTVKHYRTIALVVLVVAFFTIVFFPLSMSLGSCAAIIFAFSRYMPAKTQKGMDIYGKILGFEEFLLRTDKDKIQFEESRNIFEKMLPYAMCLGVAGQWAKIFADIYKEPPHWYAADYPHGFTLNYFIYDLNRSVACMGSTFTSTPRSVSSGGGFGGGGSSGGGFGGGGGSSW